MWARLGRPVAPVPHYRRAEQVCKFVFIPLVRANPQQLLLYMIGFCQAQLFEFGA